MNADGTTLVVGAPNDPGSEQFSTGKAFDTGEAYVYELAEMGVEAQLAIDDQSLSGDRVTVETVTMPKGGFVVIASEDGDTIYGVSEYLATGRTDSLHIELNTPLPADGTYLAAVQIDTNGNQQFDAPHVLESCFLEVDGNPLLDTAEIAVREH